MIKSYIVYYSFRRDDIYHTHNLRIFESKDKAIEYQNLCNQTLVEYQKIITGRDKVYSRYNTYTELYNSNDMSLYNQKLEEWSIRVHQQLSLPVPYTIPYESTGLYFGIEEVEKGD